MIDTKLLVKSIIYRFYSSIITVIISYIITGNYKIALTIGTIDTIIKIFTYYLFDKIWYHSIWKNIKPKRTYIS